MIKPGFKKKGRTEWASPQSHFAVPSTGDEQKHRRLRQTYKGSMQRIITIAALSQPSHLSDFTVRLFKASVYGVPRENPGSNREKVLDRVRFLSILLSTSLFFLCPSLVFSKCKDRAMFPKERITKGEGKCGEKLEKKGMVWGNVRAAVGLNWRSEKYLLKLKIKVVAATVRVFAQCCSITEGNISTESQVGLSKEACL